MVPDADLELTAQNVLASFTGCAGQRCMAAAVMVAVGDVDHIINEQKASQDMVVGEDIGAITNDDQKKNRAFNKQRIWVRHIG